MRWTTILGHVINYTVITTILQVGKTWQFQEVSAVKGAGEPHFLPAISGCSEFGYSAAPMTNKKSGRKDWGETKGSGAVELRSWR